jgi:hypothetical protein
MNYKDGLQLLRFPVMPYMLFLERIALFFLCVLRGEAVGVTFDAN